jgi:hypothetical protein
LQRDIFHSCWNLFLPIALCSSSFSVLAFAYENRKRVFE